MKFRRFKYESVISTNNVAIRLIKIDKEKSGFVFAKKQTQGKGTMGKKWISEMGNLFGSFFFPLNAKLPCFSEFAIINPVIISKVIARYCKKKEISFKKPNDIFVNEKKICGILQEVVTFNTVNYLIIGIGINIVSNPKINHGFKATNIFFESKKILTSRELIDLLVKEYENFFYRINRYNFINFKNKIESMSIN